MSLSGGQLTTDLGIKSTDKHQYLHYTAAHPYHTKCSFVFSQTFRFSRTCYNKTDFERHLIDMKSWFQARSYHKHLAQKKMSKGWFNKENSNTEQSKSKGVTFVVTYHPLLKSFQSLINKHLNILYLDENTKEVFMSWPMVALVVVENSAIYVFWWVSSGFICSPLDLMQDVMKSLPSFLIYCCYCL